MVVIKDDMCESYIYAFTDVLNGSFNSTKFTILGLMKDKDVDSIHVEIY